MEDTLRRAIVQVGDVSRVLVAIDRVAAGARARIDAGDRVQPAWGQFLARVRVALRTAVAAARALLERRGSVDRTGHCLQELMRCRSRPSSRTHEPRFRARGPPAARQRVAHGRRRECRAPGCRYARPPPRPRASVGPRAPRCVPAAGRRHSRGARALRGERPAPASRDRRARSLRADLDRRSSASARDETRTLLAALRARVRARAGEAVPRARDHRAAAQRERHRPLAVRGPRRRAARRAPPTTPTTI